MNCNNLTLITKLYKPHFALFLHPALDNFLHSLDHILRTFHVYIQVHNMLQVQQVVVFNMPSVI